jgi:hypothetical protein
MKIDRISYSLTVELPGRWEKASWDAQLEPGDDPDECYTELKARVDAKFDPPRSSDAEKIIQKDHEQLKIRIENATTRKELAMIRQHVPKEMMGYFLERQKQLINVKSADQL